MFKDKSITLVMVQNDMGRDVLESRKWIDKARTGRDGKPMNITSYKLVDGGEIESGHVLTLKEITGYNDAGLPTFSVTRFDKRTLDKDEMAAYKHEDARTKAKLAMHKFARACKSLASIDSKSLGNGKTVATHDWVATQVSEALDKMMGKATKKVGIAEI